MSSPHAARRTPHAARRTRDLLERKIPYFSFASTLRLSPHCGGFCRALTGDMMPLRWHAPSSGDFPRHAVATHSARPGCDPQTHPVFANQFLHSSVHPHPLGWMPLLHPVHPLPVGILSHFRTVHPFPLAPEGVYRSETPKTAPFCPKSTIKPQIPSFL